MLRRDPNDKGQAGQTTGISQVDPNADCTGGGDGSLRGNGPSGVLCDPMAGHGWEGSKSQVTITTGMNLVWNFLTSKPTNPTHRECVVDAVAQRTPVCTP